MNKFILGIKLKNNGELDINVILWDKRFLYNANCIKKNNFHDFFSSSNFMIFSFGEGYIERNELVLPELDIYKPNYKLSYTFDNDEDRYNYLKQLYICLKEWGKYWNDLLHDQEIVHNENIIVNGEFWIM